MWISWYKPTFLRSVPSQCSWLKMVTARFSKMLATTNQSTWQPNQKNTISTMQVVHIAYTDSSLISSTTSFPCDVARKCHEPVTVQHSFKTINICKQQMLFELTSSTITYRCKVLHFWNYIDNILYEITGKCVHRIFMMIKGITYNCI
jgi:hypothetical protein